MTTPISLDLVSLAGSLDTSCISDALDRLGIAGQCAGIRPLDRSFSLVGTAFTIEYVPTDGKGGTVGDFIDDVESGQVPVLDNSGRLDCTVWGDLLTVTAKRRGVAGTVIDGVCRDIDRAISFGYSIFSRGHWMRTGKDRVRMASIGKPVMIGGVQIHPGDLLRGDADGLVSVPADRVGEVLEAAARIQETEDEIRLKLDGGMDLVDARVSTGYHRLQSRVEGDSSLR